MNRMSQSSESIRIESQDRGSFEDRVAILFEELEMAIKWGRPSILLAVYKSEFIRAEAEASLEEKLSEVGQMVYRLQVNDERFDILPFLSRHPRRKKTIFYVSGLRWGGGRGGQNAYRALNIRREFLVDNSIRTVLWLTEAEGIDLPLHAPDFWAFRHRVIEFRDLPSPEHIVLLPEALVWHDWEPYLYDEEIDARITLRESLLDELPARDESKEARANLLYALAYLNWAKGESEKSIDLLNQGLDIAQSLPLPAMQSRFLVGLSIVYQDLKQINEAISSCRKASALDPADAKPWSNLGSIYRDLGDTKEAINACNNAIALAPKYAKPWNNLGNVYLDLGRHEEAISAYMKAIELDPRNARPWIDLGCVYREQGRIIDAINAFKKAINLNPRDMAPWYNLGGVYSDLNQNKEAVRSFKKVTRLVPKNAGSWKNLGRIYQIMDRIPDAIIAYKKAIRLVPEDASCYSALAACYRKTNRQKKVKEQIRLALPLMERENEYNRACFEAIRGNVDKAIELLRIAVEKNQVTLGSTRWDPNLEFIRDDPRFMDLVGLG